MGLPQEWDRVTVDSLCNVGNIANRQGKASANVTVAKSGESGIIKSLDIEDFEMMASAGGREIDPKAIEVISNVVQRYETEGSIFINDFYFGSLPKDPNGTPLLQIEPTGNKLLRLNVNTDVFNGRTLNEIEVMLKKADKNLAQTLEEATIHECGHAKSLKGKTIAEIKDFYAEIKNAKISGISEIAYYDGAEALAEIEILLSRGAEIPKQAKEFYNKYIGEIL